MSHIHTHNETVLPEWIDYNGHMNVAYYVLAFDHATDAVFEKIGIDASYRDGEEKSVFVVESHVTYEDEVCEGEALTIFSYVIGYDSKRIQLFHEMYAKDGTKKCASNEIMALHVDLKTRKTAELSEKFKDLLEGLKMRSHEGEAPNGLGRQIKSLEHKAKK
ncbi:thioesterase family protein [Terasakiella sp. A23]|uniref:thioesterase family protein n=1 Tax=Terasakiella sp. FCG-A23 TaxID=3080561 RepID=UPI0029550C21|nr:thioesterase family protein [Terasakiella sp. A23]MDV7338940.1 thioesterase family protein [Terasakiella sp. A23]